MLRFGVITFEHFVIVSVVLMIEETQKEYVLGRVIDLFTDKYLDQNYRNFLIDENFPDYLNGKMSFPDFDEETKKTFFHKMCGRFDQTDLHEFSYKLFSCVEFPELKMVINLWISDGYYFGWGGPGRLELVHEDQSIFDQTLHCETLGRETEKYTLPGLLENPSDWWIDPLSDTLDIWDKFKYDE